MTPTTTTTDARKAQDRAGTTGLPPGPSGHGAQDERRVFERSASGGDTRRPDRSSAGAGTVEAAVSVRAHRQVTVTDRGPASTFTLVTPPGAKESHRP
jgi:hypothetical protein